MLTLLSTFLFNYREQARLVQETLQQKGFTQAKCYFAMRYWHPFTDEVTHINHWTSYLSVPIACLVSDGHATGMCTQAGDWCTCPCLTSVSVSVSVVRVLSLGVCTMQVLSTMQKDGVESVVVVPLYPHYSVSTSGSSLKVSTLCCLLYLI